MLSAALSGLVFICNFLGDMFLPSSCLLMVGNGLEIPFFQTFQKFRFKKHIIFPKHDLILILFFQKLNDCFSIPSYVARTNGAIFKTYFLPLNHNHEFDNPLK